MMHELERVALRDHIARANRTPVHDHGRSRVDRENGLNHRPRLRDGQAGQRECLNARAVDHLHVGLGGSRRCNLRQRRLGRRT